MRSPVTNTPPTTTLSVARAARANLRPPAAAGVRFALGGGREVAARSAIVSTVTAVVAVVAAITFAFSLSRLVTTPAMFGWDFDAAVVSGSGYDNLDEPALRRILAEDPAVDAWSGAYFGADAVGDVDVPLLAMRPDSEVRPPLVSGRFVRGAGEIVLGQATASALGADIGDEIELEGAGSPHRALVVGLAVLPTIGRTHAQHTSLGTGGIVVPEQSPGSDLDILGAHHDEPLGPNAVFIRLAPDASVTEEVAHLRETTAPLTGFAGLDVVAAQRPAEIVSSDDVGAAPVLLAAGLALGAAVSLAIALTTSARTHRRELAVLTALGFTPRERAATLLWHATVVVAIGLVVGLPLGALVGRQLWEAFAERLDVLAPAVAPWSASALVSLGGLLLAAAVASWPAREARQLEVAEALRDR
jgi:putative ABC transport system permease protein